MPPDGRTGVPVDEIVAYRWDGSRFVEIPVQVDELYPYCLANDPSDFAFYSGTDKELTYEWDVESWKKIGGECFKEYSAADLPGRFGRANAAGSRRDARRRRRDRRSWRATPASQAPVAHWARSGRGRRQEIAITDPLTGAVSYVYLFRKPGGSSFDASNGYVDYQRDANADEWIDRYSFADERSREARRQQHRLRPEPRRHGVHDDPDTPDVDETLARLERPLPARRRHRHDRRLPVARDRALDGARACASRSRASRASTVPT